MAASFSGVFRRYKMGTLARNGFTYKFTFKKLKYTIEQSATSTEVSKVSETVSATVIILSSTEVSKVSETVSATVIILSYLARPFHGIKWILISLLAVSYQLPVKLEKK